MPTTVNQTARLNELEIYARRMKQEQPTQEKKEPWINVLAWVILIRENE